MTWIRFDVNACQHHQILEAGPAAALFWPHVLVIVKRFGSGGTVKAGQITPKVLLAANSLPEADPYLSLAQSGIDGLLRAGLIVKAGDTVSVAGWSHFQEDLTARDRMRVFRGKNCNDRNVTDPSVTPRSYDDGTGRDVHDNPPCSPPAGGRGDSPRESSRKKKRPVVPPDLDEGPPCGRCREGFLGAERRCCDCPAGRRRARRIRETTEREEHLARQKAARDSSPPSPGGTAKLGEVIREALGANGCEGPRKSAKAQGPDPGSPGTPRPPDRETEGLPQ